MSDNELELGIKAKVLKFLEITEEINDYDLFERLMKHRNQLHPDQYYDQESKNNANTKFIEANSLLTDLNSYINREKLKKSPSEIIKYEKEFALINTQQELVDKDKEIDFLNTKLKKYRKFIKQLIDQQKILSKETKNNEYKDLHELYKKGGKNKLGIGINVFFGVLYAFIINIDKVSQAMGKFIPFSTDIFNTIIFILICFSIILNMRKLIQNTFIVNKSKMIESTVLIGEFSQQITSNHFGSKISELGVYHFIKNYFTPKKRLLVFLYKVLGVNNDIVLEKYKNIFINTLLEKQLIKISSAKSLDREFYVYGSSWEERNKEKDEVKSELLNDDDIDVIINEIE